jgi:hypothetical protein
VRERLVSQRTAIINQIRAFLLERGIAVWQGLRFLRAELPGILAKRSDVVCTENFVRIDYVTESPNVSGDGRSVLPLPGPVRLAVQVEEPT